LEIPSAIASTINDLLQLGCPLFACFLVEMTWADLPPENVRPMAVAHLSNDPLNKQ
jgi:hypothetical protein